MKAHPESLLSVPLVAQMLSDPSVRLTCRAIDKRWVYSGLIPLSMTGFNPLQSAVYYGTRSALATWLKAPERSARGVNEGDALVREVFFAVHDYLHCWATLAIQNLAPKLGYGTAPITAKNIEDFVFCHLLTEAVATVGLDYWYLCTVDLNTVCDIGTRLRALTVGYDERRLPEYRKFSPGFTAQEPAFLARIARFYCTGRFEGFDLRALRRSPVIQGWLEHELAYGERQRETIRRWLSYLSDDLVTFTQRQLSSPVQAAKPWQLELTRLVGELLWDKVKNGHLHGFPVTAKQARRWHRRDLRRKDFRFLNAEAFRGEDLGDAFSGEGGEESFAHYLYQYASSHEYQERAPDPALDRRLEELLRSRDPALVAKLFKGHKRLRPVPGEPVDLLTLN